MVATDAHTPVPEFCPTVVPTETEISSDTGARAIDSPPAIDVVNLVLSDTQARRRHCTVNVWDVPFDRVRQSQAVRRIGRLIRRGKPSYVITANLNYVMLHHERPELREVTRHADLILADGQPIVWRSRFADRPLPQRVAGSELIFELAETAAREGWRIYLLGGAPGVAETCAKRLCQRYHSLQIVGVESPPFRPLSESEQEAQAQRIRDARPDLLLVAFGQPKGELWIHEHYRRLGVPVSIQLGASFDFIAGTARRAPRIWRRLGLEWAYRMASDPKRLVSRYAANARFLLNPNKVLRRVNVAEPAALD